ncbi:DNA alkylation repair protein [Porphyromonas circumdentaria]|uniref:3-methyladenine DNA glycosylase AlkC n=1 Tax=Porphyromonas circumdentaria TaxID=29524 RepID=A0A1T4LC93_9PORP|nr:DNA alkylation repair protein [Porphyromonas circumdentaria]MBB6275316.1 3-methyladenine DNA glycosylase AlkC [Porphyromonas circumdentaria]MDO4722820.1 DNA alkylation repair protein [Porphyromonas circumdentaria]SJZ52320.1 3-methyladenine DNA glycosylase AlkC [Porphyromonas circumdentaria]
MGTSYSITDMFGRELAELLTDKIMTVYKDFDAGGFIYDAEHEVVGKTYTQRIAVLAELLRKFLPERYEEALSILLSILGDENPNQTGMFTNYYWVMPIGKFVQEYGLEHFEASIAAISEITKRNTGEYAIRPYLRKYPTETLQVMKQWAVSPDFHLRRLASEGLRPKLPWAPKLDTFVDDPEPVFQVLEILKEDEIMFVKKSVANHLTDWLKVNKDAVIPLLWRWQTSHNPHTQWIVKRATRKISIDSGDSNISTQ